MTLDRGNWGSKFEVYRPNVKVSRNKNVRLFFVHIFVKSKMIYIKPSPK